MRRPLVSAAVLFLAAAALGAPPAEAQTPSTAVGLGYPVPPVDARAAALGSTGVGLLGGTFSLRNPAELTQHPASGIGISLQPEGVDVESEDGSAESGRSRFSVLRAVVRLEDWAVGVGFGGELDQDFVVRIQDTLQLDIGRFPFEERREHDGGVSAVELALARSLGPVSVGVAGQRLTGSLRQRFDRRFEISFPDSTRRIENVSSEEIFSYGGWRGKVGASVQLGSRVLVGGALSWAGSLTAEPEEEGGASQEFDLPPTAELGFSVRPSEEVLLTAAGGWSGWSDLGDAEDGSALEAADATWTGAGLEYWGASLLGMGVPLRVGIRRAELPFSPAGGEQATETAASLGLGFVFAQQELAVAEGNLALEFGSRGDLGETGFEESFRRLTLSFTLRQP